MKPLFALLLSLASALLCLPLALGGSATWTGEDPGSPYVWEYETNWRPNTIPEEQDDVATFDVASNTFIFVGAYSGGIDPGTIIFNPGASQYTFKMEYEGLTLTKAGIINNSGVTQTFETSVGSSLRFEGSASAASSQTMLVSDGSYGSAEEQIQFYDHSSAGESTCITLGTDVGGGGRIFFHDKSSADHATLIAEPSVNSEGDAGYIFFNEKSQGDAARVVLLGGEPGTVPGQLEIYARSPFSRDVTIGSLEGVGNVTLAQEYNQFAANLIVGVNNLSTTFAGVIWYGYYFLNDGSLTKVGTGTLTLTGANLHRGGTIVKRGKLLVNNVTGSGTAGPVMVGDGGHNAILEPGDPQNPPVPLTIQSDVSFMSSATLRTRINSNNSAAGAIVANGVTISGAQFSANDVGNTKLPLGTVLTAINNTSATPISGTFANLPDGETITIRSNTFQANYEGGDGNDLTLTVVP
jgi:autotransporter-associated beta strand protein